MVSVRFTNSLLLVLIMLYVKYSSAQTHYQGVSERILGPIGSPKVVGVEGTTLMNFEKGIHDDEPTAAEVGKKRHGGRKIMRLLGMVNVKEQGVGVGDDIKNNNYISGERIRNNIAEFSRRIRSPRRRLKEKMAGFIPFSADYHVPRPHPPKNN